MKKIIIAFLLFPAFSFGQRTFDVRGVSVVHDMRPTGKIIKADMKIVISDSDFTEISDGKTHSFKITKKVNPNYFQISDGLQEAVISVVETKTKKYSGWISQQMDNKNLTILAYYE